MDELRGNLSAANWADHMEMSTLSREFDADEAGRDKKGTSSIEHPAAQVGER